MRKVLIIAILSAYQSIATAQNVYVVGSGVNSCKQWSFYRTRHTDWHQSAQWINGFYTGLQAGLVGQVKFRHEDPEYLRAYVDKYCAQNPSKEIYDAATQLMRELDLRNSR